MKILINSSYSKKLKYKLYSFDGKKNNLIIKGDFFHNAEIIIKTTETYLIVRVQRCNLFIALLRAILIIPLNFINGAAPGTFPSQTTSIVLYEEIKIMLFNYKQDVVIQYEKSPMLKDKVPFEKTLRVNYLSCQTYPYETNLTEKRTINIVLYTFAIIFWIALIIAICLIIRFFVLHR